MIATAVVMPAPARAGPSFTVSYAGSGAWRTSYHSTPPNPGGAADTNDAHDSSTQSWRLTYTKPLQIATGMLTFARGAERAAGTIDHSHIDGLFRYDDAGVRCRIRVVTAPGAALPVILLARYDRVRGMLTLTLTDPVTDALALLPAECPGQTDPIDGLADNLFTPGFSFGSTWGPARWFAQQVVVPVRTLRARRLVRIRVRPERAGTPPRGCEVPAPAYERCVTGGRWSGVLTITRRG